MNFKIANSENPKDSFHWRQWYYARAWKHCHWKQTPSNLRSTSVLSSCVIRKFFENGIDRKRPTFGKVVIDGQESGNSRSRSREREFTGKYREREMPFPDLEIPVGKGNKFSVPGKTREFPNKIRRYRGSNPCSLIGGIRWAMGSNH